MRKKETSPEAEAPRLQLRREGDVLHLHFSGVWTQKNGGSSPDLAPVFEALKEPGLRRVESDVEAVGAWDSLLPAFLLQCQKRSSECGVGFDVDSLKGGLERIFKLALAVEEKEGARKEQKRTPFLPRLGNAALEWAHAAADALSFLGECMLSFRRVFHGKARFRWSDVALIVQQCGAQALPIVTLISFLVGLIMAYVGVVQLQQFGATIYVANLVALAMVREMGAMMTAVIMSGRTGAAFAAELGSMKVSDEISALRTFGIAPMDFLIFPRVVALVAMMPLLTIYSDLIGIIGGGLVAVGMGLTPTQYITQTVGSLTLTGCSTGIIKSVVFGFIVAFVGCLRGMQCGSSSEAVGRATTTAVVTSITWIIVADAFFAVLFDVIGI